MTVLGTLYARRRRLGEVRRHRARLGGEVRALLELRTEDVVTLGEFRCAHPGCAGVDTVFLVMRAGRRAESMTINRAMADITRADLVRAVAVVRERTGATIVGDLS